VIVLLERGAGREEVQGVLERMRALGLAGTELELGTQRLIHVTGGRTRRARHLLSEPAVQAIVPTSGPRVRREGRRFYPFHALCAGAMGLVLLGLLVFLAGFFPPGVSDVLAPGEAPPPPEWPAYLAPLRALLALAPDRPAWLGPSLLVLLAALGLALPALDRTRGEGLRARAPVLLAGLFVLVLVALGLAGGGS
jgi:hypothetical protein